MTDDLFFDTDCLSAFLWINDTSILQTLYGGRIILPEPVYRELANPKVPHLKRRADILIETQMALIREIEVNTEEYALYRGLTEGIGRKKCIGHGEAAGIALAKVYNGILASNNYKDIAPYIEEYNLKHTDTARILKAAFEQNIITENEGNDLWKQMLARNRKLPALSFTNFLKSF